jgi:SAM-dependent methyltransferase
LKIVYVGNFSQQHCSEVHIAKTLENLGHDVVRLQEDPKYKDSLISIVKDSDMLLFTRTWSNLITLDHLEQIEKMNIPTVSYHLDLYVGLKRQKGIETDPFWRTKYVFTPDGDPLSKEFFNSRGINHYYMKPAVFKDECIQLQKNNDTSLTAEIIFVGGGLEYAHEEWPYRRKLIKWLMSTYPSRYKKFGHPQKTVRNIELNQLYSNSKIVIGDSLCINFDHPYYWSDRVYETIGRGGFIIHPYIKGLDEEFTDGENIVFYEFNNFEQLKEKIDFYLNNDKDRESIRNNGFNFVKENATYNNRLTQMLDIVTEREKMSIHTDDSIKINLGSGNDPKNGFVNVDFIKLNSVDVVHNLMEFPYPFEDNSASKIRAVDVLEHLANYTDDKRPSIIAFIEECHRILKPGGELFIQTPRYDADFLWLDPTHVRGFHEESMDFFDPTSHYGQSTGFYSDAKFSVKCEILKNKNLRFYMVKI